MIKTYKVRVNGSQHEVMADDESALLQELIKANLVSEMNEIEILEINYNRFTDGKEAFEYVHSIKLNLYDCK